MILSPNTSHLTMADLSYPFLTFSSQLRALLGVPHIPTINPSPSKAHWQTSALMRERIVQNARDSIQRLVALSRQVKEIRNMRIPLAVQKDVQGALESLSLVSGWDRQSRCPTYEFEQVKTHNLTQAMKQSAEALDLAKRAAFNHEMLALIYFPDEHKWAVYTPLFGPIGEAFWSSSTNLLDLNSNAFPLQRCRSSWH